MIILSYIMFSVRIKIGCKVLGSTVLYVVFDFGILGWCGLSTMGCRFISCTEQLSEFLVFYMDLIFFGLVWTSPQIQTHIGFFASWTRLMISY